MKNDGIGRIFGDPTSGFIVQKELDLLCPLKLCLLLEKKT